MFVFDTETEAIRPGLGAPRLVSMAYAQDNRPAFLFRWDYVKPNFYPKEGLVIGHNVSFDHAVLLEHDPEFTDPIFTAYDEGRVRDTMHRAALQWIREGRFQQLQGMLSLSGVSEAFTGVSLAKGDDTWRLRYGELRDVPIHKWPVEAVKYAKKDPEATRAVFLSQQDSPDEVLQARAGFALKLMSVYGFRTSEEKILELWSDLQTRRDRAARACEELGIFRVDGSRDMKILQGIIERALGDKAPRTPKGNIQTSAEVIQDVLDAAEDGGKDNLLKDYAEVVKIDKIIDTYIPAFLDGIAYPINPGYRDIVETGRTSCREPNVQNLPRMSGVRECITARPGTVFVACDWSSAELVALAQVTYAFFGFSDMRDALNEGKDLHLMLAGSILGGVSYEEAKRRKKAEDSEIANARQLAKIANFGYPGGLGAGSFVSFARGYGVRLSEERAAELKKQWKAQWSEMNPYFEHISKLTSAKGPRAIEALGSGRVRGNLNYSQAANGYFQQLIADAAKDLLWEIIKRVYWKKDTVLSHFRPIFFVHDEVIGEAPEHLAHEIAMELRELFIQVLAKWCPDVRGDATVHLMRHWSKKADEAFRDGRLIPWEDRER